MLKNHCSIIITLKIVNIIIVDIIIIIIIGLIIMVESEIMALFLLFIILLIILIISTRPKPAYGRQGLAGSWGQDTDEVSNFLVFLTSHFAPAVLSSDLNQPVTIDDDKNPLGIMKTELDP